MIGKIIDRLKSDLLLKQSVFTLLLRVLGVITLFGFTLFLTHNYSPKIVGQYDFTRTFLLLIGSVALLGTDQSVLYFAGKLKALKTSKCTPVICPSIKSINLLISISDAFELRVKSAVDCNVPPFNVK